MSEKLCTLRTQGGGGGAKQTETVLWTNSSPTSSFAKQDVTLSDDINNYDYLKFTYRVTTSVTDFLSVVISVSDFKKSVESTSSHHCVLGITTDDSTAHTRRVYYKTDTTVNFNNAYQLNAVASANTACIPTSIIGIKNMGGRGWAAGPMFEIVCCSGGNTTAYNNHTISNDTTLMDNTNSINRTDSITVKRAAKGKIYLNQAQRGTPQSYTVFTIHNIQYSTNDYVTLSPQTGIDIEFAANDTISFTTGISSAYFMTGSLTFIEE